MSEVILSNKPNASQELESRIRRSNNKSDDMINPSKTALIATYTEEMTSTIRTTCPYCGVGCGVLASVDAIGVVSVKGDPEHPANFGKLCSKGSALAQTLGSERRLTEPYYQNKLASMAQQQPITYHSHAYSATAALNNLASTVPTDWNSVLDDIATRLNETITKHGRDSIMFYVSGQLLTEDYYVANKFIKGFIGNNNIDSNSRLCMSSAVAGHKRAFGADLVLGNYEDLEACDLLVLVGSNMAWCHPILFGRFLAAKKADPSKKLIAIDPRRTDSCEFADLHLPIAAGTDTHLYNGLLHYLSEHSCADIGYIEHGHGVDDAFMPIHWSNAFASFARVGTLIPTFVDQYSGQPELKNSAIRMSAVPMQTLGKIMVHPDLQDTILVHLRAMTAHFKKKAIAGESQTASTNFELNGACSSLSLPALTWSISRQASTDAIPVQQRYKWLLAGRPATGYIDPGPLVCSCMAVGENIIVNAIAKQQCHSAQAVGEACRAGTNCGSCVGQINALIEEYAS